MELRHLRYFVAVAEELHFGRAAKKLHIAQPPLSQQIKRLEADLGVQLFSRTKRSVQLTDARRTFLQGARLTLRDAEHAVRAARRAHLGEIGHLRLGFVDSAIYTYLPGLLSEFRARYPDVDVELVELPSRAQPQALIDDRVDVSLMREPIPDTLDSFSIAREEVVVLVPSTHALAGRDEISLSDLVDEPLILFDRPNDPRTYDRLLPVLHDAGINIVVRQEANELRTIVALVSSGFGIGFGPESLRYWNTPGLSLCRLRPAPVIVDTMVAWRRDDRSEVLRVFLETARDPAWFERVSAPRP